MSRRDLILLLKTLMPAPIIPYIRKEPKSAAKEKPMADDRLKAFESMLESIQTDYEFKSAEVARLKAEGKEKTVTFKQFLADKLLYQRMLSLYEEHGLL